jgi:hypothetical protein
MVSKCRKLDGKFMKWADEQTEEDSTATQGKMKMTEDGSEMGEKTTDSPPVKQNETTAALAEEERPPAEEKPSAQDKLVAEHSLLAENKPMVEG